MDPGSMPIERSGSTPPQGQGQGPSAMAEQQQVAADTAAADAHTQAHPHGGVPIRTFYSLRAAQDHVRQQDLILTEQARNLGTLSTHIDEISIQLTQLLSLVRHREVAFSMEKWSADRDATSAFMVSGSKPIPISLSEPSSVATNVRQSKAEILSVEETTDPDPHRQARRESISRDRTSASPPALQSPNWRHLSHSSYTTTGTISNLFSQEAHALQDNSDDGSVTAARHRPQTVNVDLLSFYGKYAMIERSHSLYISSARTWQYLFCFIHYLLSCYCHSSRINCFARFDGIRSLL
jgi:hypothetical protein